MFFITIFFYFLDATKIELNPKKYQKAAWLVSNCHTHSEREHYVEELQKYFPVGKKHICLKNIGPVHTKYHST